MPHITMNTYLYLTISYIYLCVCVRVRACVRVCVATSIPVFSIAFTEVLSVEFIATIIKASATKYSYNYSNTHS